MKNFLSDSSGATAIEYSLIVAVLSLAVLGGMTVAFDAIEFLFGDNNSKINAAIN